MLETINGVSVKLLGDQHLGRRFRNGVPLHRLGEREQMVRDQFVRELNPHGATIHVNMGDLFDKTIVPLNVIMFAAYGYREAARKNPNTTYFVLRGNHDASRDADVVSAYEVFAALVDDEPNILVLQDDVHVCQARDTVLAFVPWHPFKTAAEMVERVPSGVHAVFGHWDIENFGGPTDNYMPYDLLRARTKLVYTGHVHKPRRFDSSGLEVVVVGSMQPYAFGESDEIDDPRKPNYITITPEVLENVEPDAFRDDVVRLVLKKGEPIPEIDCLQLVVKREGEEEVDLSVEFEEFNMERLFKEAFAEAGADNAVLEEVLGKYREMTMGAAA